MVSRHFPAMGFLILLSAPILPLIGQATATSLYGQSRGEIQVYVRDSTGHPLQTHGTLYGPVAGSGRAVDSAADGSIAISDLAFGPYSLAIAQTGFASQTINFQVRSSAPSLATSSCLWAASRQQSM